MWLSPQNVTGVNACSGISKILVNFGRAIISSWKWKFPQEWTTGKPRRAVSLKSGQYLHCTGLSKQGMAPITWHGEGLRSSSRRSSGLSPQTSSRFMWKRAHKLVPGFESLSYPLLSHLGLWFYVTQMQSHSLDCHKPSLFHCPLSNWNKLSGILNREMFVKETQNTTF